MSTAKDSRLVQEKQSAKVELFISCRKLKNVDYVSLTDPQVKLHIERNGKYEFFDQTEVKDNNLNPDFSKTFVLDYYFEIKQKLKFEIVDIDYPNITHPVGEVLTTLGEIVGSRNQTAVFDIMNKSEKTGKLVIKCEQAHNSFSSAFFEFHAENLENPKGGLLSKLILKLSRPMEDSGFVHIYESEHIQNNVNPKWKNFDLNVQKLCNGDLFRPIKVEIFSRAFFTETLIGECEFTLNELQNKELPSFTLRDRNKNKCGILKLKQFSFVDGESYFLNYLRGGVQLSVVLAIDFTGSNGDPLDPTSLHAMMHVGNLNEYQKAMLGVCEILLNYDYDKKIPVYGFGAEPRFPEYRSSSVDHCFPVKGNAKDPYCTGLDEIMSAYQNCLRYVSFSGPTYFGPVIQQAMNVARANKASGSNEYTILLIITDGEIHDMEITINYLIESARLPLSVIIVGVGSANFTNMEILDGDHGLYNLEGVKAQRDLVQFVPFSELNGDQEKLAKHVLEEIPKQLVEYMINEGIKPKPPQKADINSIIKKQEKKIDNINSKKSEFSFLHVAVITVLIAVILWLVAEKL